MVRKLKILIVILLLWLCFGTGTRSYAQGADLLFIDLAVDRVDITSGFSGATLTLFGMKKAEGDLAIIVRGPKRKAVVRHKQQVSGIWMNTESVKFGNVPVYYDMALSTSEQDLSSVEVRHEYGIGLETLDFVPHGRNSEGVVKRFKEALIRNKQVQGHFPLEAKQIYFLNNDFFRTSFIIPSDVPTGDYIVEAYLFKDGQILDIDKAQLKVAQKGFSARLYALAHGQPFAYGFMAVLMAMIAGASAYFFMKRD